MPSRVWWRQNRFWVWQFGLAAALLMALTLVSGSWVPVAASRLSRLFGADGSDLRAVLAELDLERQRQATLRATIDSLSARFTSDAAETTILKQIRESCGEAGVSIISYDQLQSSDRMSMSTPSFRIMTAGTYDQHAIMLSRLYRSNPQLQVESLALERVGASTGKLRCVVVMGAAKRE